MDLTSQQMHLDTQIKVSEDEELPSRGGIFLSSESLAFVKLSCQKAINMRGTDTKYSSFLEFALIEQSGEFCSLVIYNEPLENAV